MTDTVTRQFVTQFDSSLRLLAQQKVSRLRGTVYDRGQVTGASFTINNLGDAGDFDENVTRHGDTIFSDIDHTARNVPMRDFFKALPLDRADIPKMLANPVTGGQYMQQLLAARNRKVDDIIFQAALGTIVSVDSQASYSLPSSQVIAAGGTGLTKAKIIQARSLFRANEADEEEELFFLWDSLAMQQILSDTTLTNADFMAGKMLQEGNVAGKWLGFTWVPFERVLNNGGVRTTAAYAKSAIHFGTGYEKGDVDKRPDKKNLWQTSMEASYGAGRQDEKKVVLISYQ
ncbi:phage capsid protein [uncultured Pseudacidovorax sp.]|uniref:phage capsid protein n=1 Tax=uncultured Pseudacidovorax sp. TaxID=679313 RepID=UPI0025FC0A56|nr:phage capsid protein [uncultured Pseudacidovorax sp.]